MKFAWSNEDFSLCKDNILETVEDDMVHIRHNALRDAFEMHHLCVVSDMWLTRSEHSDSVVLMTSLSDAAHVDLAWSHYFGDVIFLSENEIALAGL